MMINKKKKMQKSRQSNNSVPLSLIYMHEEGLDSKMQLTFEDKRKSLENKNVANDGKKVIEGTRKSVKSFKTSAKCLKVQKMKA